MKSDPMTNKPFFQRFSPLLFGLMLLICACVSQAQVVVSPIQGLGSFQLFDSNGELATGGVIYSYQAGTSTQQATYTDSTGTILNPNPIPFGSGARVSIWLVSADFYKFVACSQNDGASCAPSDVLFSVDNVPGSPAGASGSPFTGIFISGTIVPATTGILRLATADTICWRNSAGTSNLCLTKNTNDVLSWPAAFSAANFVSVCTPAALTGAIELCDTDTINWRNHAATADLALSKDSSDNLNWPNGFNVGTNLGAATLGLSGVFTSTSSTYDALGTEVSTPATPPASGTDQLYPKATHGFCAQDSSSNEYCMVANGGAVNPAVLASSITLLGSPVSVSGTVTVLTKAVTMPSTGCPCRAFVSYGTYWDATAAGQFSNTVNDGTNTFATAQTNTTGSATDIGVSASSYSPGTYANSAAITFTLQARTSAAGTTNVHVGNGTGLGQVTWMNVTILSSN